MAATTRVGTFMALVRALRGAVRPGEPRLGERLRSVPRLVRQTVSGQYAGTTRGRLVAVAAALLYILSPVDLVPDVLLPFGLVDDAVVLTWVVGRLLGETDAFLRWERAEASGGSGRQRRGRGRGGSPRVVRGQVVR
jgi:uncharacterized membrane protein YkvA (DUF1232 family)